jgi:hypothetical protein
MKRATLRSGRPEPVGFHPLQEFLRDGIARLRTNDGIDAAHWTQRCLAYALPFVGPFLDCCRWKDRTAIEAATVLACQQFLAVVTGMPMCANVIWRCHRILVYRTSLAVQASSTFGERRKSEVPPGRIYLARRGRRLTLSHPPIRPRPAEPREQHHRLVWPAGLRARAAP